MEAQRKLDSLPRLGWVRAPSPVSALSSLGRALGLEYLGAKRDDLLDPAPGGSKVRKLDHLLAQPPFREVAAWASMGAIGSGHLVALTEAARRLERKLVAHLFWEPISAGVLDNLAFTASGPTELHFYPSRLRLALSRPRLFLQQSHRGAAVIPPGATRPEAMVGLVRAGLELAEQINQGELPCPERVYVALGTGGTAAGLAVGLGMGGVHTTVHAVATVERALAPARLLRSRVASLRRFLAEQGVPLNTEPAPWVVDRSQLGPGYGVPTAQSLAACELVLGEGLALEPVYTGKAMAALLADAGRKKRPARVLFWHTARRGPLPRAEGWMERLPPALARRLEVATRQRGLGRRRLIAGGALATLGALAALRFSGYPQLTGWTGKMLSSREALVLAAAAEVILPRQAGVDPFTVAANVDRFLLALPPYLLREVHALLGLVEHGTTPLGMRLSRFSSLPLDAREAFLLSLSARGGLLATAWRGLRDLCLLGYYQEPVSWEELGYSGPWGPAPTSDSRTPYQSFRARGGALPKGARG